MIYDGAMRVKPALLVLVGASSVLVPGTVLAQDDDEFEEDEGAEDEEYEENDAEPFDGEQRDHDALRFDAHLMVGYYAELGLGVRLDIPIVSSGLIDGIDDDLSITVGAEVMYIYYSMFEGVGVYPVLALQWNFYLSESWSIFPEIGVTLLFSKNREVWFETFIAPHAMFGVRWHFSERNAIFVRAGWPAGVQLGVTF
jgi:hypothetical protein